VEASVYVKAALRGQPVAKHFSCLLMGKGQFDYIRCGNSPPHQFNITHEEASQEFINSLILGKPWPIVIMTYL
jgi:hypothetical protein